MQLQQPKLEFGEGTTERGPFATTVEARRLIKRRLTGASLPGRCIHILVASICCVLTATAVNAVLRVVSPGIFAPSQKLLDAVAELNINTVFFGTSRIENGIIPDVFDKKMRDIGITEINSYNLAQPDSLFIESFADAERLFALKPTGIKFVVFEPNFAGQLVNLDVNTLRAINYFTFPHAYRAIEMIDPPLLEAMGLSRHTYDTRVLGATARHYFSIGLAWAQPEPPSNRFSVGSRGFPDRNSNEYRELKPDESYQKTVHWIATSPPQAELISDGQLDLVLSFAAYIKAHGAIPVMIRTPQTAVWNFAAGFAAKFTQRCAGKGPLYLDFTSPNEHPELWNPQNRQDDDHLNAAGAAIFTRLIADGVAAAIRDNSVDAPLCDAKNLR